MSSVRIEMEIIGNKQIGFVKGLLQKFVIAKDTECGSM